MSSKCYSLHVLVVHLIPSVLEGPRLFQRELVLKVQEMQPTSVGAMATVKAANKDLFMC